MYKLSTETWIATCATFIALCALFVSVWEGVQTRRHNKLSTNPNLGIRVSISQNHASMGVFIENNGLGPAILEKLVVYIDNQPTTMENVMGIFDSKVTLLTHLNQLTVKEGQRLELISYPKKTWTPEGIKQFSKQLARLYFKIFYKSIYQERFETSIPKMNLVEIKNLTSDEPDR